MGTFANVPEDKYESLSAEDKAAVDAWRNQENDVTAQEAGAGTYDDVITRDDAQAVDSPKTTAKKATSK